MNGRHLALFEVDVGRSGEATMGWGDTVLEIDYLYLLAYNGGAHVCMTKLGRRRNLTIFSLIIARPIDGLIANTRGIKPHNCSKVDCSGLG